MFQNSFEKFLVYAIKSGVFIILFLPLLVTNSLYFPYITGKNFSFRIITEIIFLFYLILIFKNKAYRPKFSILSILFFLFVIANLIATITGANPYHSFWGNYERMIGFLGYIHYFLFFLIILSIFKEEEEWRNLFKISIFVSFLVSFYALAQKFSLFGLTNPGRLDSTFGNPLYLGVFIILNIFFILYFLLKSNSWLKFAGWSALFIFEIYILLNTFSRGSFLGLVSGLILFLFLSLFVKHNDELLPKAKNKKTDVIIPEKILKIISATLLFILILSIILVVIFRNSEFVQNLPYISRVTILFKTGLFQEDRLTLLKIALKGIKEKPIFGWGPENYFYLYNKYFDPVMNKSNVFFDRVHNMPIDVLIESGIIGLLLYLLIFIFSTFIIFKLIIKQRQHTLFYTAILAGLAGYFIQNLSLFDNLTSFLLFFIILAYLDFSFNNLKYKNLQKDDVKFQKLIKKQPEILGSQLMLLIILIIPFIYFLYFLNIKPLLAANYTVAAYKSPTIDKALNLFKKSANLKTFGNFELGIAAGDYFLKIQNIKIENEQSLKIKNEFEDFIIQVLNENIKKDPQDFKSLLMLSKIYSNKNDFESALKILGKLLELNPKEQKTYISIANIYADLQNYEKAIEILKKAAQIWPENKEVYFASSRIYLTKQDLKSAIEQFKIIEDLTNKEANLLKENEKINLKIQDLQKIAKIYANGGYLSLAEESFKQIIQLNPKYNQAYFDLAYFYSQLNQKQKALDVLNQLLNIDPSQNSKINQFIQEFQLLK